MLQSYFKLALKVLARKKFFTFISLFGISFTLMILMLVTSFLDNEFGNHAPMTERDRMVFVPAGNTKLMIPDTTYVVDSSLVGSVMQYDSTMEIGERQTSMSRSSLSLYLLDNAIKDIQGATKQGYFVPGVEYSVFKNNKKLDLDAIASNAAYWDIFDFEFTEGSKITAQDIENQAQVAVITEKTAREYFGQTTGLVGKEMVLDKKNFKVVGVVKTPDTNHDYVYASLYIPHTILPKFIEGGPEDLLTAFNAVYLAENEAGRQLIKDDLDRIAKEFEMPFPEQYNKIEFEAADFNEYYAMEVLNFDTYKESETYAIGILAFLLTLFILLPTLNLININISRILERASEIGVRKSFGADTATILKQFVFENVILTLIGGIIGFVLALGLIAMINNGGWLNGIILKFNVKVFLYSFLICLLFGIISGLIPAYRMSKMQIVTSLKSGGK